MMGDKKTRKSERILSRFFFEKYGYIFLMIIAFTTRVGSHVVPQDVPKIISLIIFIYVSILFLMKKNREGRRPLIKTLFFMYFVPALIIHLYSIIMMAVGKMDSEFFSWNLSEYAPILAAISSVFLFGKDALRYTFIALIASWFFSVFGAVVDQGIGIFPYAINQAYFSNYTPILGVEANYLELHDMVFSVGLLAVYYAYKSNKLNKKIFPIALVCTLIFLLGMKRIAVAGLICGVLLALLLKRKDEDRLSKYRIIFGSIVAAVSVGYIIMIFSDDLYKFVGDINLMSRNYYYDVIKGYGELSPLFVGTGRNSVSMILTRYHSYLRVGGVHSDILKMYIENGFLMFIIWLWYYLFMLPRIIMKKFDIKTMGLYICLIVYMFIVYLTDNVENYFIVQTLFVMIPVSYYLDNRRRDRAK